MKNLKRAETKWMAAITVLALFAPLAISWFRYRTLHADSASLLSNQVFARERNEIEAELGERNSNSINPHDTAARWAVFQRSMKDQGATPAEAKSVLGAAQDYCGTDDYGNSVPHWPISVERGIVRNKPVWVAVCARRADHSKPVEIVTGWEYRVRTVDPLHPMEMSGIYADNMTFPRCYGPNSPFPVSP